MNGLVQEIKDSIVQAGLVANLTPEHIAAVMAVALLCGIVIYIIYRVFYRGPVYNESFAVLNVITCMTTAFIIMSISTNIVLSLGMVGALSIVRFRAAVKDPLDIGFLFLSIAAGLTAGAGLFPLAGIGTLAICTVYILMSLVSNRKRLFLLSVKFTGEREPILAIMKPYRPKIKSVISSKETTEINAAVKNSAIKDDLTRLLLENEAVSSAVMIEYTGD
ncbi:MAG: DUF4956 domain-containing protein [Ruminococcus sp.]|jgi:uncharacterized membrane protein YhiD involved in acid resistance|nr:DUF4956 domain-containing protein [Ruminococcus sp.]